MTGSRFGNAVAFGRSVISIAVIPLSLIGSQFLVHFLLQRVVLLRRIYGLSMQFHVCSACDIAVPFYKCGCKVRGCDNSVSTMGSLFVCWDGCIANAYQRWWRRHQFRLQRANFRYRIEQTTSRSLPASFPEAPTLILSWQISSRWWRTQERKDLQPAIFTRARFVTFKDVEQLLMDCNLRASIS